jgi:hypothetical protein
MRARIWSFIGPAASRLAQTLGPEQTVCYAWKAGVPRARYHQLCVQGKPARTAVQCATSLLWTRNAPPQVLEMSYFAYLSRHCCEGADRQWAPLPVESMANLTAPCTWLYAVTCWGPDLLPGSPPLSPRFLLVQLYTSLPFAETRWQSLWLALGRQVRRPSQAAVSAPQPWT